jgi:hypothetical protein
MCSDVAAVVHHFLGLKTHRQMERMIAAPSFVDGGSVSAAPINEISQLLALAN